MRLGAVAGGVECRCRRRVRVVEDGAVAGDHALARRDRHGARTGGTGSGLPEDDPRIRRPAPVSPVVMLDEEGVGARGATRVRRALRRAVGARGIRCRARIAPVLDRRTVGLRRADPDVADDRRVDDRARGSRADEGSREREHARARDDSRSGVTAAFHAMDGDARMAGQQAVCRGPSPRCRWFCSTGCCDRRQGAAETGSRGSRRERTEDQPSSASAACAALRPAHAPMSTTAAGDSTVEPARNNPFTPGTSRPWRRTGAHAQLIDWGAATCW